MKKTLTLKQKRIILFASVGVILAVASIVILYLLRAPLPLTVGGVDIDDGLYRYFLDQVQANPEKYALVDGAPNTQIREEADKLAARYAAVERKFAGEGLRLSTGDKETASDALNNHWQVFGKYYEGIGVAKTALARIYENQAKHDALFRKQYDKGGASEVAEADVRKMWDAGYVVFRSFSASLTSVDERGQSVALTDAEKKALQQKFANLALDANNGKSIDELFERYYGTEGDGVPLQLLIKNQPSGYDDDFFGKVRAIQAGATQVVEGKSEIFLVWRDDTPVDESELYPQHRAACLRLLKGTEFDASINRDATTLVVERNSIAVNRAIRAVISN
ncbi:MAG: hypothetical protein LBN05_04625 [Oscillospiraceae bacterium]|jgi:hypothetical protein|nr:hypothetical protein [Oscillospiraceae bacterium]